jgi:hypothetical protein
MFIFRRKHQFNFKQVIFSFSGDSQLIQQANKGARTQELDSRAKDQPLWTINPSRLLVVSVTRSTVQGPLFYRNESISALYVHLIYDTSRHTAKIRICNH